MTFDWRSATEEEVEHQYSPSRHALAPLDTYLEHYRAVSTPFAGRDLVIPGRPLVIYIHGGYWQALSAGESLFNAPDAALHGVSLTAVEYVLAPRATIGQMVQECIGAVTELLDRAAAPKVVLAGSSAGAHLAAMCAMSPLLAGRIGLAVLMSGVYDLRPVVRISDNAALGLDHDTAAELSPQLLPLGGFAHRTIIACGGHDPAEFIRQSRDFAARLAGSGRDVLEIVDMQRDHFGLPLDLLREGTVLGDHVLSHLADPEAA